jgi:hypothetical protein
LPGGGHGNVQNGVTYHPNNGLTVATPPSLRDHRNGNNAGGGVTVTTGTPNPNLGHGGIQNNQPSQHWRGIGIIRDHRGSGHHR